MDNTPLYNKLNDYVKLKSLKSTKQRDAIVKTFFDYGTEHIKIEELLAKSRKKNPKIGYATVYRTLMLLVEAGVALQRQFGNGQSQFELNHENQHHDHMICTSCGLIVEFKNNTIEDLQKQVAKKHHFNLSAHKMELYGVCQDCQKKS